MWAKKDEIQYFSEPWRLADQGVGTGEKFCLQISCLGDAGRAQHYEGVEYLLMPRLSRLEQNDNGVARM